jgi:PTH1 family peptidyl-tRNA hydrolase
MVLERLAERWSLGRAKDRYRGRLVEGKVSAAAFAPAAGSASTEAPGQSAATAGSGAGGGVRVALLCPQTYMNDAGRSVGPARGALKVPLERVLVVHDEIDLPFGEVRTRVGGGLAGHNGLKSLKRELGSADFARVRVGVGRPASTDPEIVSAYVLGRFREPAEQVEELIDSACRAAEHVVLGVE